MDELSFLGVGGDCLKMLGDKLQKHVPLQVTRSVDLNITRSVDLNIFL